MNQTITMIYKAKLTKYSAKIIDCRRYVHGIGVWVEYPEPRPAILIFGLYFDSSCDNYFDNNDQIMRKLKGE